MRRSSINIDAVEDLKNNLYHESRRSFKASETNDIVPKIMLEEFIRIKQRQSSDDRIEDIPYLTSTSSSYMNSDSSTPTFQSVLIIYDDNVETVLPSKRSVRVSKVFYSKANLKLMDVPSSISYIDEDPQVETPITIQDDREVLNRALDLIRKFKRTGSNHTVYSKDSKMTLPLLSFSFTNRDSLESPFYSEDISMKGKYLQNNTKPFNFWKTDSDTNTFSPKISSNLSTTKIPSSQLSFLNLSTNLEDTSVIYSFNKKRTMSEGIYTMKIDEIASSEKRKVHSDDFISSKMKTTEDGVRTKMQDDTDRNTYKTRKTSLLVEKNDLTERNVYTNMKPMITSATNPNYVRNNNIKKSNQNISPTFDKDVKFSLGGCNRKLNILLKEVTELEIKRFKIVCETKSFTIPNIEKISISKTSEKVDPNKQLLLFDDIAVLKKGTIISVNDVSDAISKTIILRYFGLTMLPDSRLMQNAVRIVEQNSERLKYFFDKKYPMLQKSICSMINHLNYGEFNFTRKKLGLPQSKISKQRPSKTNHEDNPYWLSFDSVLKRMSLNPNRDKPVILSVNGTRKISNYDINKRRYYHTNGLYHYQTRL